MENSKNEWREMTEMMEFLKFLFLGQCACAEGTADDNFRTGKVQNFKFFIPVLPRVPLFFGAPPQVNGRYLLSRPLAYQSIFE